VVSVDALQRDRERDKTTGSCPQCSWNTGSFVESSLKNPPDTGCLCVNTLTERKYAHRKSGREERGARGREGGRGRREGLEGRRSTGGELGSTVKRGAGEREREEGLGIPGTAGVADNDRMFSSNSFVSAPIGASPDSVAGRWRRIRKIHL